MKSTMYKVGEEYQTKAKGCINLCGKQQGPHMYALFVNMKEA